MRRQSLIFIFLIFTLVTSSLPTVASPNHHDPIGEFGTGNGQFDRPQNILSVDDHFYVTEEGNDRIQIFDTDWNYVDQFGGTGAGTGQFNGPDGIATNGTHLFVTDYGNDRVQIFDLEGNYQTQFGTSGSGDGQLNSPIDITLYENKIYVAEFSNDRVQVFNQSNFAHMFYIEGTFGYSDLQSPRAVEINNDVLYVTDGLNNTVKMYHFNNGDFIDYIDLHVFDPNPWDIEIVNTRLFVTHLSGRAIEVYDLSNNYIGQIQSHFENLRSMTFTDHSLYVADYGKDLIHHLRLVASPTDVSATTGQNSVTVTWGIDNLEGISDPQSFRIYRQNNGSGFELIAETNNLHYVDFTVEQSKDYEYQIQAVSNIGVSTVVNSNSVTFGHVEPTPTDDDDGSFFDSVPLPVLPFIATLLAIPLIRKYRK